MQEALDTMPEIVLICTDTSSHVPICQEVLIHNNTNLKGIMIEKPISFSMEGVETIKSMCKERNVKLMTSCNLRFNNGVELISLLLNSKTIGKPLSCQYYFGHNLRLWHKDRDYSKSYSALTNGGILNDDIHAIDLLMYLFGNPTDIKGILHKSGILEIKNEDIASYVVKFDSGVIGSISSDYLSPFYMRNIQIVGEQGIIHWSFDEGYVNLKNDDIKEWRTFSTQEPINNMYLNELIYFINCVEKNETPFSDGIEPLKWILKLKEQNNGK